MFQHIMLYYFNKGKKTIEMQKKKTCTVYREGAVTECANFVQEISHWMMLPWSDRLVEVMVTKLRH